MQESKAKDSMMGISPADQAIMDANLVRMTNSDTSLGRKLRVMACSKKIDEMKELTNELQACYRVDGNHLLDVEKKLRILRVEARPYEEDMEERFIEGLLDRRGLDSSSGTRNEKLERLLYHADYFYDDHKNGRLAL